MKKHTFQENYEKIFGSIEEGWWDNMGDAAKKAYIKKHGSAPGSAGGDEDDYDMGVEPGSRDSGPWTPEDDPDFEKGSSLTSAPGRVPDEDGSERLGQIAQEKAAAEKEMAHAEEMGDKNAYADAQEKIDDLDKEEAELGGSGD
jgi:hypothetical protein